MTDDALRITVLRLVAESRESAGRGDLPAAIDASMRACELVREAIETAPWDPANPQQLGSMLYAIGEWQLRSGEFAAAVAALDEAEEAYGRLGAEGTQLVADVVIRRARVRMVAGEPLSAIADAQQATLACLELIADGDCSRTDAARVVGLAAQVLLAMGADPDLAVAAADWSLREYLAAFRVGDQFALPADQAPAVQAAAVVAFAVHTAAGRTELAGMARWFLGVAEGSAEHAEAMVEHVSGRRTLAEVLASVGRDELAEQLTAPPTDVALLVPAMRCQPQLAPVHAQALGEAMVETRTEDDEVLLGLEAHALFAAASRARVIGMRFQFGTFGIHWAAAVVNVGQRMAEAGLDTAALDAARWLTGIIGQLAPHALVDDKVRGVMLDCATWQHGLYAGTGDAETAARVAELIETLQPASS